MEPRRAEVLLHPTRHSWLGDVVRSISFDVDDVVDNISSDTKGFVLAPVFGVFQGDLHKLGS